ncbi:MAG: hypothetical protein LBT10_06665 [Methanobrevibacter sp.]|jgi:hypothetical protein|nr:hypothetical protein [Methanobrevibacter sp.]
MDRKLKILWFIVIIGFIASSAFGLGVIKGSGNTGIKGKLQVTDLGFTNQSQGFINSYSIWCSVKVLSNIDYVKMNTRYYDKDMNLLAENDNVYEKKDLLTSNQFDIYEYIGYQAEPNGKLPVKIEIMFFDDPNENNKDYSIYYTSLLIDPSFNYLFKNS